MAPCVSSEKSQISWYPIWQASILESINFEPQPDGKSETKRFHPHTFVKRNWNHPFWATKCYQFGTVEVDPQRDSALLTQTTCDHKKHPSNQASTTFSGLALSTTKVAFPITCAGVDGAYDCLAGSRDMVLTFSWRQINLEVKMGTNLDPVYLDPSQKGHVFKVQVC